MFDPTKRRRKLIVLYEMIGALTKCLKPVKAIGCRRAKRRLLPEF